MSPDGNFYWDGQKWAPNPAPPEAVAPPQAKRGGIPRPLIVVLLIIVLVVAAAICVGATGGSHGGNLKLTADVRGLHPSTVGEEGGESISVTNNDTDVSDLVIFYANKDNWLDHHVATGLGRCTIDKGINAFRCGPLKAGQTVTITITGTAKDRGNYNYAWGLGDASSNGLRQWDQEFTWSEAVT